MEFSKDKVDNSISIKGIIKEGLKFSHTAYGIDFYSFKLGVKRKSGYEDILPVIISENTIGDKAYGVGDVVELIGRLRSHNADSSVNVYIFVEQINSILTSNFEFNNTVHIRGFVCKKPIFRSTPKNRVITDMVIAANRQNSKKSDYINTIAWGSRAVESKELGVGDEIIIEGRFQSRKYTKKLKTCEKEKIAYELSVLNIKKIGSNAKMNNH
ncbi:single-stranded DNA-binding protein [Alkaliphilus sp. B6464]|uniref:single-stranded DNA-binding protein n=1 Tax=Alkaliphilus sp. B6464 TaxID=2731219 RepID=UPI001BACE07C|nr:single-stranded DNA-binding protein [Alkaliphilus sp. B6464]QUH21739.1 single-stranded DNA-binding protein [Alkaliphilus sp. B6464]